MFLLTRMKSKLSSTPDILLPKKQLQGVDIFKYIMALGVVAIHVTADKCTGTEFPKLFMWFIQLAVPFFFITSGFLLGREITHSPVSQRRPLLKIRCYKICKLFFLWILIYIPISLLCFPYGHKPIYRLFLSIIGNILINGEILYAWPLWFLYSLLLTSIGLWITASSKSMRNLFITFVCITYIIFQTINYIGITDLPKWVQIAWKHLPIRSISGGAYLLFGIFIYKAFEKFVNTYSIILLICISLALFLSGLPFSEIAGGGGLFLISIFMPFDNKKLSKSMRIQSMWIYYLHMYVIFTAIAISRLWGIQLQLWPTYLTVLIVTITIAFILSKLQTTSQFKFLGYLTK